MGRVGNREQGAAGYVHKLKCPNFQVKGKISSGEVLGVCSKCGKVLERHGKQGVRAPSKGWERE